MRFRPVVVFVCLLTWSGLLAETRPEQAPPEQARAELETELWKLVPVQWHPLPVQWHPLSAPAATEGEDSGQLIVAAAKLVQHHDDLFEIVMTARSCRKSWPTGADRDALLAFMDDPLRRQALELLDHVVT